MSTVVSKMFEAWIKQVRHLTERITKESQRLVAVSVELAATSRDLRAAAVRLRAQPNERRRLAFDCRQRSAALGVETPSPPAHDAPSEQLSLVTPKEPAGALASIGVGTDVVWLPHEDPESEPLACCPRCREPLFLFPPDGGKLFVCPRCGFVSRSLTPSGLATARRNVAQLWVNHGREARTERRRARLS